MIGRTGLLPLFNAQAILHSATKIGDWYPVVGAVAIGLYIVQTVSAGAPSITYYLDASPYRADDLSSASTAISYVSQTIATSLTSVVMVQYSPTLLNVPVRSVRMRAVAGAGSDDSAVITALLAPFTTG
jgi:hypothetical protein